MDNLRKGVFQGLKTIVVKVGSRILVGSEGDISRKSLEAIVNEICKLHDLGYRMVLVSSGAVGAGMSSFGYNERPRKLASKQACAAIGQIRLMQMYSEVFHAQQKITAQLLVTGDDFRNKTRYGNIRNTVDTLLARKVIPIINENDTVSTDEIAVGDNDKLSADVAHFLEADLLIILSDESGLFTSNPKLRKNAEKISVVPKVTPEIMRMAGAAGSVLAVGGMKTKLEAIRQATMAGTPAILMSGRKPNLIAAVAGEDAGTLFLPNPSRIKQGKRWLAYVSKAKGKLFLDEGGVKALKGGKSSLLPAGILNVKGVFHVGDFVELCTSNGENIGRGRVSYNTDEVQKIQGLNSKKISEILHRKGPEEVVHRDNLVIY